MADAPTEKPGRINIRVPDIYKQVDESVWEELESYIFTGFLSSAALVQDKSLVFKTINHHELKNIQFMRSLSKSQPENSGLFRAAFISYSLFMIDGNNVLYERARNVNRLIKTINKMAAKQQEAILDNLSSMNERAHNLLPLVEIYVYENRSRYRWLQFKHIPIHSTLATGISGTDGLGMNVCQQTWIALNHIIDRQDNSEREWQNAKFIGSCMAGKGIRAIDEKDKMRREKDRINREELKMKVLYKYLNRKIGQEVGEEEPAPITLPDGRQAMVVKRFRADSAEELAQQLSAALSGELDYHDQVIRAKEDEFRARATVMESHRRTMYSAPAIFPEVAGGGSRIIGGKAEAEAHLKRMRMMREDQRKRAQRTYSPDQQDSDDASKEE